MREFRTDVTVVGGGIAGLWAAKELVDQGLTVDVVERGNLATGATTRNEGWLHAGTYHAVMIDNETDARNVTERTIYGHDAILDFAPEAIEHSTTYAFLGEDQIAHNALWRWDSFGVRHRQVPIAPFAEEGFVTKRIRAAYAVKDKSVHSRILCEKLAADIVENGGRIFTNTEFHPVDSTTADLIIDGEQHRVNSDAFVVAAGAGIRPIFEEITGKQFPMRYYKSHLLVTPRLTADNFFYLDPLEAGIMSHGGTSIVGINREAVVLESPDCEVIPKTERLVYDALGRMLPRARQYAYGSADIQGVACVKVDVAPENMVNADPDRICQDLNIKVFEPTPGYVCALPGKMTEAPFLAKKVREHVMGSGLRASGATAPRANLQDPAQHRVSLRPADQWMLGRTLPARLESPAA